MIQWIRDVAESVQDRSGPSAEMTERRGRSPKNGRDKESGVSTVEYALIIVTVVAAVALGGAAMQGAFNTLFTELTNQITTAEDNLDEVDTGNVPPADDGTN